MLLHLVASKMQPPAIFAEHMCDDDINKHKRTIHEHEVIVKSGGDRGSEFNDCG
jgi:hypothetical protein